MLMKNVCQGCLNLILTYTLMENFNGKFSVPEPCSSKFDVSDCEQVKHLFKTTKYDDKPSFFFIEDRRFLELIDTEMKRDNNSHD